MVKNDRDLSYPQESREIEMGDEQPTAGPSGSRLITLTEDQFQLLLAQLQNAATPRTTHTTPLAPQDISTHTLVKDRVDSLRKPLKASFGERAPFTFNGRNFMAWRAVILKDTRHIEADRILTET